MRSLIISLWGVESLRGVFQPVPGIYPKSGGWGGRSLCVDSLFISDLSVHHAQASPQDPFQDPNLSPGEMPNGLCEAGNKDFPINLGNPLSESITRHLNIAFFHRKLIHFHYKMSHLPASGSHTLPQAQTTFQSTKAGKLGVPCQLSMLFLPKQLGRAGKVYAAPSFKASWCLGFVAELPFLSLFKILAKQQLCLLFWVVCLRCLEVSQRSRILRVVHTDRAVKDQRSKFYTLESVVNIAAHASPQMK